MNSMAAAMSSGDNYVARLKESRTRPAVLKSKLVKIKSMFPNVLIFAFEGKDDKVIYYNWTKRIRSDIEYEPFPCDGKKYVLQLVDIVNRDLGNIGDNIYFFVDRDFDDNSSLAAKKNVYITGFYSIENYLVSSGVVADLLKNDLHCHGEVELRRKVVQVFEDLYESFLGLTKEVNFRIYIARRGGYQLTHQLPDKINKIAHISIGSVGAPGLSAEEVIKLSREPSIDETNALLAEFDSLDPRERYRGKFAMMFFRKWLQHLVDDINRPTNERVFFSSVQGNFTANTITLDSLAAKSRVPDCFIEFIGKIPIPV